MRRLLVVAALLLSGCDGCEKKDAGPQAAPEPVDASDAGVASRPQILKDGGPPSDPMLGNVGPIPMPPPSVTEPLARANDAFAFDLYKRLAKLPDNVTFSPTSISLALSMTWAGAKGETAAQMKKVLHATAEAGPNADAWGKTTRALGSRTMKLRIANRLFGEKTHTFEQPFLDLTQRAFGAPLEPVDFAGAHEAVRGRINHWVEEQTEKRIKDLLPPRSLTPETRLVLANAVYFLADWATPFDKTKTADEPFFVNGKTEKKVPMMHKAERLRATKADGVTMVLLPYARGEAAFFLVLPDKRDGIAALESSMTVERFDAWKKGLSDHLVDLTMPRFEITSLSMPLVEHLSALGMPLAFDRKQADFTGIAAPKSPDDRIALGNVVHKAFVKVDEKGTEAAAATAGIATATTSVETPPPPLKVTADHPFLFFIVEKDSGLVLFMGRVADPG